MRRASSPCHSIFSHTTLWEKLFSSSSPTAPCESRHLSLPSLILRCGKGKFLSLLADQREQFSLPPPNQGEGNILRPLPDQGEGPAHLKPYFCGWYHPPTSSVSGSASLGPHVPGSYSRTGVTSPRIGCTTAHAASTASSRANSIPSPDMASVSSRS